MTFATLVNGANPCAVARFEAVSRHSLRIFDFRQGGDVQVISKSSSVTFTLSQPAEGKDVHVLVEWKDLCQDRIDIVIEGVTFHLFKRFAMRMVGGGCVVDGDIVPYQSRLYVQAGQPVFDHHVKELQLLTK
jgi:hypothetical protein